MMAAWSVVLRQPEAHRWQELSFYAFLLGRLPAVAEVWFPLPDSLESERARFERVGDELWVLEWDLAGTLNEFKTGYQLAENLNAKKFSIVYHTDNFNMRVYKLMEDVEALIALVGGRDPRRASRKGEPSRRDFVEALLKEHGLASILHVLRRFRERPLIKAAIEDRNRFVHSYRDEPDHEWRWKMLVPAARLRDHGDTADQLAKELKRLAEPALVDDYADAKADVLLDTLREIQEFRDHLYGNALAELAARVQTQTGAVEERLRWIVDANEVWQDLVSLADRSADHEKATRDSEREKRCES
jgi:hypothetical protein